MCISECLEGRLSMSVTGAWLLVMSLKTESAISESHRADCLVEFKVLNRIPPFSRYTPTVMFTQIKSSEIIDGIFELSMQYSR